MLPCKPEETYTVYLYFFPPSLAVSSKSLSRFQDLLTVLNSSQIGQGHADMCAPYSINVCAEAECFLQFFSPTALRQSVFQVTSIGVTQCPPCSMLEHLIVVPLCICVTDTGTWALWNGRTHISWSVSHSRLQGSCRMEIWPWLSSSRQRETLGDSRAAGSGS